MSELTYSEVGSTAGRLPEGYRHVRAERTIGSGRGDFDRVVTDLFAGEVQRRAGMTVQMSSDPLRVGTTLRMTMRMGPLRFVIPCRVVWAERTAESAGFAYGTLPGHPERGEERFDVRLTESGDVVLRITAFSAPARWFTRVGAPCARVVQDRMTQRYLGALAAGR